MTTGVNELGRIGISETGFGGDTVSLNFLFQMLNLCVPGLIQIDICVGY